MFFVCCGWRFGYGGGDVVKFFLIFGVCFVVDWWCCWCMGYGCGLGGCGG